MNTESCINVCEKTYTFLGSSFVANLIYFATLFVAVLTLKKGGKKVSEILQSYNIQRQQAIFGYHVNLKVFIQRLKRLVGDIKGEPMLSLNLFSCNEQLRSKANGCESLAENIVRLSQSMLDYLSTKPNQIPASMNEDDFETWDKLIEELINFLSDFLLYDTGLYLSYFDNEDKISQYHDRLINNLDQIVSLIDMSKTKLKEQMVKYNN